MIKQKIVTLNNFLVSIISTGYTNENQNTQQHCQLYMFGEIY